VMGVHEVVPHPTLEQILAADQWARHCATDWVTQHGKSN